MAGIFNLFGTNSEIDKGQVTKPLARSKTLLGMTQTPAKAFKQQKPKGLSIRSNSDLNIPVTPSLGSSKAGASNNEEQKFLKPKLTQLDHNGRPVSPMKELSAKRSNVQPIKMKGHTPKNEVSRKKSMKIWEPPPENLFKQPLPPKENLRKPLIPEPEELAPFYEMKLEYDIYADTIRNEFNELLKKKKMEVKPYEDEEFQLDQKHICIQIPMLSTSPQSIGQGWKNWTPELPEICDDDNF